MLQSARGGEMCAHNTHKLAAEVGSVREGGGKWGRAGGGAVVVIASLEREFPFPSIVQSCFFPSPKLILCIVKRF